MLTAQQRDSLPNLPKIFLWKRSFCVALSTLHLIFVEHAKKLAKTVHNINTYTILLSFVYIHSSKLVFTHLHPRIQNCGLNNLKYSNSLFNTRHLIDTYVLKNFMHTQHNSSSGTGKEFKPCYPWCATYQVLSVFSDPDK